MTTTAENAKTLDIVVTRIIDAPLKLVWQSWTDPEHVKRWWGPKDYTSPLCELDLRVGGKYIFCMRAPQEQGGQDSYTSGVYTRIVSMQLLEFTQGLSDKDGNRIDPASIGMPPDFPREIHTVVAFKAKGSMTELVITESGWTPSQMMVYSFAGMHQSLDKLAEILAQDEIKSGGELGKVAVGLTMSLDGFIAGPDGEVGPLFNWYFSGDTEVKFPVGEFKVKVSATSAAILNESIRTIGAIVSGRKQFDIAHAWGGQHPMNVPVFVVTHRPPPEWIYEGSPFTFVTDGVESAVRQAKAAAGGKNVGVDGANVVDQCIKAGLIDEIHLQLVPILMGEGVRLFEHLGGQPINLEILNVTEDTNITHLGYRIVK